MNNEIFYTFQPEYLYGRFDNACEEDLKEISSIIKSNKDIIIEKYNGSISLFNNYGIEKEILKLRHKKEKFKYYLFQI